MPEGGKTTLRRRARGIVGGAVGALGYELVRRTYYSPIPDLARLPADVWTREDPLIGLDFDTARGLAFVQRELGQHISEYHPPLHATDDPRRFYTQNTLYESVDSETLYAMVRRFAPERIVELGSGMSTLVIADARERNGQRDRALHTVYDPYPREDLRGALESVAELRALSATNAPLSVFEELRAGDILFVDTTHTVKIAGDVNRIVLDILPRIAPGVLVHIHDIYLPFEYPREFLAERRFFWAEQYLLQAFLAFNERFETLFGAHSLMRSCPEEMMRLVPSARPGIRPSAFWIRRVG